MQIYCQQISVNVELVTPDLVLADCKYVDSVHDLDVSLICSVKDWLIVGSNAKYNRCPWDFCSQVESLMGKLVGLEVGPGIHKKVTQTVGGAVGCTHLAHAVNETIKALWQALMRVKFGNLTPNEQNDLLQSRRGTCFAFSGDIISGPHEELRASSQSIKAFLDNLGGGQEPGGKID